jgi:hypothetical protein
MRFPVLTGPPFGLVEDDIGTRVTKALWKVRRRLEANDVPKSTERAFDGDDGLRRIPFRIGVFSARDGRSPLHADRESGSYATSDGARVTGQLFVECATPRLRGDIHLSLELSRVVWLLIVCETDARHPVPVTGGATRSPQQAGKSDAMREVATR